MQRLTELDAAFIYLESPRTPMHVGGLYVFAPPAPDRPLDFTAWREHIAGRLQVSRTLRQRLMRVPLDLDRPYWALDPEFTLDAHLGQMHLPAPGGWQELMALAEQAFSRPLVQDRPLWEMVLVSGLDRLEGVPPGALAMLVKVHHGAADGVSSEHMVRALLDPAPRPRPAAGSETGRSPRLPGRAELLVRAGFEGFRIPLSLAQLAGRLGAAAVRVAAERVLRQTPLPPLLFTAPATRFNAAVTPPRVFRSLLLPLERVKALKRAAPGSTINDVVLAICAGALRRYLLGHGELPDKPLIAAVPVSIRGKGQWQAMGNQASAMLVALATDQADPIERLAAIHRGSFEAKAYSGALRLDWLAQLVPSAVGSSIPPLLAQLQRRHWLRPAFNLFITNVAGPRQPLHLNGARLLYYLGTAPIIDSLGLVLVVTSCLDTLCISATSCRQILPDPDSFIDCLRIGLEELEAAA